MRNLGKRFPWRGALGAFFLASLPIFLLALAGCTDPPVYPAYLPAHLPPLTGVTPIQATERDAHEQHIIDLAGRLKALLYADLTSESEAERARLIDTLEQQGVDWRTYLIKTVDAHDFPWQAAYNHVYWSRWQHFDRQRNRALRATGEPPPADNVLADDNVPDSAFFTNVVLESYTPERLAAEAAEIRPVGNITITKPKTSGTAEGFFGKDERGIEYIFVFDPPFNPEMNTAAEYIGSTLVRMAGYRVPKTAICTIQGTGNPQYDGRRAVGTIAVKGYKGGWKYRTHRTRREIRAVRLFAAWIDNVDQTDQNTGTSELKDGVCLYYIWDFGASLGSFTFRPKLPRLGWTYLWKPSELFLGPLRRLGLCDTSWDLDFHQYSVAVGVFSDNFDPERWVTFYPNFAFDDATTADKLWAAEKIGRFSNEQIRAVVALAQYTYPSDAEYVTRVLMSRRDKIRQRYLSNGEWGMGNDLGRGVP